MILHKNFEVILKFEQLYIKKLLIAKCNLHLWIEKSDFLRCENEALKLSNVSIDLKSAENMAPKACIVIDLHKIEEIYVKNGAFQNIFSYQKAKLSNVNDSLSGKIQIFP